MIKLRSILIRSNKTRLKQTVTISICNHQQQTRSIQSTSTSSPFSTSTTTSSTSTQSPQELLQFYSQRAPRAVTLNDLVKYGSPPLTEVELLESGENTRMELLCGLARRVTAHLSLPFLPATNPSLQLIYKLYSNAFLNLVELKPITNLEENEKLCRVISEMVDEHRDNIPILAKGFQESRKYLPASTITSFLNRAIRNRITLRLIAEQHLSLSSASLPSLTSNSSTPTTSKSKSKSTTTNKSKSTSTSSTTSKNPLIEPSARSHSITIPSTSTSLASSHTNSGRIGVLDLNLSPSQMVKACANYVSELCEATYGVAPKFEIIESGGSGQVGDKGVVVGGIGVHLEYILTELLKNSFRATVEFQSKQLAQSTVLEGQEEEEEDSDVFKFKELPYEHLNSKDLPKVQVRIGIVDGVLSIRIRDRGGGIAPENTSKIFSYAFTTVPLLADPDADPDDSPLSINTNTNSTSYNSFNSTSGAEGEDGYYTGSHAGNSGGGGGGESSLKTGLGTLAGLGFGLPLSRLYAGYFGGSLDLVSMYGWGTDCYIVLRTV